MTDSRRAEIRRQIQDQYAPDKPEPVESWSPQWERTRALALQTEKHKAHVAKHRKARTGAKRQLFDVPAQLFQ
jgi:hypothetical protein